MRPKDCAYIVEHLSVRFMAMVADHSRQLAEHRAAFGARTEADAKIIAGLRAEIVAERMAMQRDSLMSERDGLLTQVQDMRAEIERLRIEAAKCKAARDDLYQREGIEQKRRMDVEDERDALRAEVAALQERLRSSIARGDFAQMEVAALKSQSPKHPWTFANCEPCDQPATHDTEAGKAAAESAAQHSAGIDIGTWSRKVTP